MQKRAQEGFSLVELSIVLVILGLLVGGVLGGKNLIKAAQLRAITTEFSQWQTAVNTFREKYSQYPGDLSNATFYWGEDSCPPTVGSVLTATCNGDGDGIISQHNDYDELPESFLFWQHLQKAGLISGEFTGVRGPNSAWENVAGVNAPRSSYSGAGWAVESNGDHTDDEHYEMDTTNSFVFGANGSDEMMYNPILTPAEAWSIDVKVDDGKPGRGNVIAIWWGWCDEATSATDYNKEYQVEAEEARCALYFRGGI